MMRKIWLFNFVLFCIAIFLLSVAYRSFRYSRMEGGFSDERPSARDYDTPKFNPMRLQISNYDLIVKNNLFSKERTEFKPSPEPEKIASERVPEVAEDLPPEIKNKYKLFGIIIEDRNSKVLVKIPVKERGENPVQWFSVGDNLDGYQLVEIAEDRIFIQKNAKKYPILLYEGKDNVSESRATVEAPVSNDEPQVISTGKTDNSGRKQEASGEVIIDGKYKIIETPFGKSRIRIK